MGEAKRKRDASGPPPANPRHLDRAFRGFVEMVWKGAPPDQVKELRIAFFAGAMSYATTVMTKSDLGGDEPTDADMQLMDHLQFELEEAAMDAMMGIVTTGGSGRG